VHRRRSRVRGTHHRRSLPILGPYTGDAPKAFLPRNAIRNLLRPFAEVINSPVHTGVDVTRFSAATGGTFNLGTSLGSIPATKVVLATGARQVPKLPSAAAKLPKKIVLLRTHDCRNPRQLRGGAVLILGPILAIDGRDRLLTAATRTS